MDEKETKVEDVNNVNIEENVNKEQNIVEEQKQEKPVKKKGPVRKTLGIFGRIIGWAILIFAVAVFIRAMVLKKYDVFGMRFYMIMSGSMEPTIHVGDAVISKEMPDYNEGDVIAFNQGGATTVHRIIKVYTEEGKELYQTQGDNNNTQDKGLRTQEDVYGKVLFRIPKAGDAILFLQKNIIIVILAIGIIIIIALVRRLI